MNVSLKNDGAARGIITVEIEKNDYAEKLEKNLHKLRQKVNMPGFRKGMVPAGLVKKLYGKHALAEEVEKLTTENLVAYIRDNNIRILGQPIPSDTDQPEINFETDEKFEFSFDVALSPTIDVKLSKEDILPYYRIKVDDEAIDKRIDTYRKELGTYDTVDEFEDDDMIKGKLVETENGEPKEGCIFVEDAVLMPSYMKGKMEQKKFKGAKKGAKITFNPYKAYKGAEAEISSLLKIEKDAVKGMKSDFTFEIKEITRYKKAELNEDLYDRIFGKGAVGDEASFREKIGETVTAQYNSESEWIFKKKMRKMFVDKLSGIAFADDILKRSFLASSEKMTEEDLEKEYPEILEDLKYRLFREELLKENNVTVEDSEVEEQARSLTRIQFAQYGMFSVPDDVLEKYVKGMLGNEETRANMVDKAIEDKVSAVVKDMITVEEKEVTEEELGNVAYEGQEI
ncbi:MAG: trigger factor [Tannerella sp.]|jgi:trigger factor|nr:trigger factor [Tannerella sp.]